jgi:hypothetical protein
MDGWIIKQMGGTKTDECLKEVTFAISGRLYGRHGLLIGGQLDPIYSNWKDELIKERSIDAKQVR